MCTNPLFPLDHSDVTSCARCHFPRGAHRCDHGVPLDESCGSCFLEQVEPQIDSMEPEQRVKFFDAFMDRWCIQCGAMLADNGTDCPCEDEKDAHSA